MKRILSAWNDHLRALPALNRFGRLHARASPGLKFEKVRWLVSWRRSAGNTWMILLRSLFVSHCHAFVIFVALTPPALMQVEIVRLESASILRSLRSVP